MGYFPFFVNIESEKGLIVGGGAVALRKIQKLLPFSPELKVIAPEICEEIRELPGIQLEEREYRPGDEAGMKFVIAATDSRETNRIVALRCREEKIAVNTADDLELCSFIFPALVKRGRLTLGISTEGSSPGAAIYIKDRIDQVLPENLEEILDFLSEKRQYIREHISDEKLRQTVMKALLSACMEKGRALNQEETTEIIGEEAGGFGKL